MLLYGLQSRHLDSTLGKMRGRPDADEVQLLLSGELPGIIVRTAAFLKYVVQSCETDRKGLGVKYCPSFFLFILLYVKQIVC